jgi:hypothetical protein
MSAQRYRTAARVLLAALFVVCIYRAFTQSITFDEALTWDLYVKGPVSDLFHLYRANHHFLNSVLMRLSAGIFGVSEWSLRLPALAGAALYFVACYHLARFAFGDGFSMLLALLLVSLNPLVLDFMVAARGYGQALALLIFAMAILLREISRQTYLPKAMAAAGALLAFSVTANLVFVLPAAALAGVTLYFVTRHRPVITVPTPPRPPPVRKKKKAPATKPSKPGFSPVAAFIIPIVAIAVLFLSLAPFESMQSEHFYTGAATIQASLQSLATSSLQHSGPLRRHAWVTHWSNAIALAIAPLVVIVGLAAGILRRNVLLILAAGAAVFSAIVSVLIHVLLNVAYPADRTGLYYLPLAALALVSLAYMWRSAQGFGRAASIAAYTLCIVLVLHFATEFNTRKFLVWEYDADSRPLADYIASHRPKNVEVVRVGGSWQLQESLKFYATLQNWTWAELRSEAPVAGLEYYAFLPWERNLEQQLGLTEVYKGGVSGSALAQPPSVAANSTQ